MELSHAWLWETKCYFLGLWIKQSGCGTLTHFNALRLHADVVTSLVHCNGYLFSSSVDCTIKVWFATEGQNWRSGNGLK
ncbi:hypothetical protein V6Z12_D10G127100 [Gossypium hirsutum]